MAGVGPLTYKTDNSFYFDAMEFFFTHQCNSVNLIMNSKKTKERLLSFSKTCAGYDNSFCLLVVIQSDFLQY